MRVLACHKISQSEKNAKWIKCYAVLCVYVYSKRLREFIQPNFPAKSQQFVYTVFFGFMRNHIWHII